MGNLAVLKTPRPHSKQSSVYGADALTLALACSVLEASENVILRRRKLYKSLLKVIQIAISDLLLSAGLLDRDPSGQMTGQQWKTMMTSST